MGGFYRDWTHRPTGRHLQGYHTGLALWNAADGKEIRRFVAGTWNTAAAFTPGGKVLAGATDEG